MEIILLQRVEKLGQMGDVVNVKPGFARNFLLPQKMAIRANKDNLARFEAEKAQLEAANLERKSEAQAVAEKMEGLRVVLIRAASEGGQLYGSVTSRDIAAAVTEAGFSVSRNQVLMEKPVKTLGIFDFRVRLHPEVDVTVSINVAQSDEEAQAQADRVARGEPAVLTAAELDAQIAAEVAKEQADAIAVAAAEVEAEEEAEAASEQAEEATEE
ncbi:50S ribosomal protein L9 [Aestuariispira insulae]|uniref:Large ribosomal subunit protein bL9 n=1 Tax=Aestuariispira insulae TaxID=1461337 RepID=A0A3D9HVP2_9PROT|nr:50S ribosomal protein L9 [Aestuariispira insulae]RED53562.1 large subunit ribosomal protein L9 [Aestuariispira insulae]